MIPYQELRNKLGQQRDRLEEDIAACKQQIQVLETTVRQSIMTSQQGLECSFALAKNQKTIKAHKRHLHELSRRQNRILKELSCLPEPCPGFDLTNYPNVSFH